MMNKTLKDICWHFLGNNLRKKTNAQNLNRKETKQSSVHEHSYKKIYKNKKIKKKCFSDLLQKSDSKSSPSKMDSNFLKSQTYMHEDKT